MGCADQAALDSGLGDLRDVIRDAGGAEKAAIYEQLGLKVTFEPEKNNIERGPPPFIISCEIRIIAVHP
jgi:hypothetical protein